MTTQPTYPPPGTWNARNLLTVLEVAEWARVHPKTVYRWIKEGKLVLPPTPQDTQFRVASRYGKTLWEHAPNAKALFGYEQGNRRVGGYLQVLERVKEWL